MKFAKELEEQAVPEWRYKYLDYKAGKKKIKAVTKAIRNADAPTSTERRPSKPRSPFSSLRDAPVYSFLQIGRTETQVPPKQSLDTTTPLQRSRSENEAREVRESPQLSQFGDNAVDATPRARPILNERSPLVPGGQQRPQTQQKGRMTRYGSIIGTPPADGSPIMERLRLAPSLELPEPAIDDEDDRQQYKESSETVRPDGRASEDVQRPSLNRDRHTVATETVTLPPPSHRGNAHDIGRPTDSALRRRSFFHPRPPQQADIALEAYRELEFRQTEFFRFLDSELQKIESFYEEKERAARERMSVLREQLHIMRDRRLEDILAAQARNPERNKAVPAHLRSNGAPRTAAGIADDIQVPMTSALENGNAELDKKKAYRRAHPLKASFDMTRETLERYRTGRLGKTSKAMGDLGTPRGLTAQQRLEHHRDYVRRNGAHTDPPYRTAKRKLKVAMAEFYRGLELLKGYAMLNRTAFRKIGKKFDKTGVTSGTGKEYVASHVNTAPFVQSGTLDELLLEVEDLYARYFERGNHKIAASKLRAKANRSGSFYGPVLRTGLLLAAGFVLGLQGVVYGSIHQYPEPGNISEERRAMEASFLMQIYGGYFLMLLLVGLFCVDTAVFTHFKVNYQFIFDFDARHFLDWKELCELPAWFAFLLGLTLWLNFTIMAGGDMMYVYWPVVLVGLSLILLFIPPPWFYFKARAWFLASNFRLLLAGLYPVEFRDFFLGDMFCSQTYAMGNIELFFCAYARHWNGMGQCNSSHSRLLGFFQTLPGIWRLFQCLRRYYDSGLWTHLANGLKYTATISQYVSLSLWRIAKPNYSLEALFIACATMNSCYCIFWDLFYDWSMPMSIYHRPPLLRDQLAYRRHKWWYYAAIAIDPILRFNWIFYVIYADEVQHASLISFLISLSEVFRRGMWVLFRVENEHSTNVGRYRAQRDPALPYDVSGPSDQEGLLEDIATRADGQEGAQEVAVQVPGRDEESGSASGPAPPPSGSLRQRWLSGSPSHSSPVMAAFKRAQNTMLAAHALDYERKKPSEDEEARRASDDDDEDDDDDDEVEAA
ncbi:hypothetical protein KC340_g7248 [Hortaea werneckii]|nr:hypothetical protein KC342_g8906 [Hortaea werneckii]KAI7110235.1 hypothetical protein KC339_g173 [Hortaea werneckii]KAI7235336.1 hypothetical protein KC365_g5620 [Hortaea werneckii]KAI7321847.1 hypothetical protein KC340_g7248 [Hortaea werneckii]KAI7398293.1 hypothetical protein KC328_g4519 [Hortaea werneckii]